MFNYNDQFTRNKELIKLDTGELKYKLYREVENGIIRSFINTPCPVCGVRQVWQLDRQIGLHLWICSGCWRVKENRKEYKYWLPQYPQITVKLREYNNNDNIGLQQKSY